MIIVGLGNPGEKYQRTRHNVGFMVLDRLIDELNALDISKDSFKGLLYRIDKNYLLKPTTFMNLSGESVFKVVSYFKIEKVVVIHDDLDIPFGSIRFKQGGGHGGHNGLKSIDEYIGNNYIRVRIGIGRPKNKNEVANYVLSNFLPIEEEKLDTILNIAKEACVCLLKGENLQTISNRFTVK